MFDPHFIQLQKNYKWTVDEQSVIKLQKWSLKILRIKWIVEHLYTSNTRKHVCVRAHTHTHTHTELKSYDDLGLYTILAITLYILWYQLIHHKAHVFLPCLVQLM